MKQSGQDKNYVLLALIAVSINNAFAATTVTNCARSPYSRLSPFVLMVYCLRQAYRRSLLIPGRVTTPGLLRLFHSGVLLYRRRRACQISG